MAIGAVWNPASVAATAVHADMAVASIEELNNKLSEISKKHWGGRNLPFLVLLDGGGKINIPGTKNTKTFGATTAAYGVRGWPTTVLIDKQGKVVGQLEDFNSQTFIQELEKLLDVARSTNEIPTK